MAEILSTLSAGGNEGTPTGTGDFYVLLSTWEAAQQSDLVTDGNTAVLECYDFVCNDVRTDISGWGTGATNFITIRNATGVSTGVVGSGFRVVVAINNPIVNGQEYTQIIGVSATATESGKLAFRTNAANTIFDKCIGSAPNAGRGFSIAAANSILRRCLATDCGLQGYSTFVENAVTFENCTAADCGTYGFEKVFGVGKDILVNCLAIGNVTDYSIGGSGVGSTNNASGDTTADGTSPQINVSQVAGVDLVDYAGGDYSPAVGGKIDTPNGTTPPLFSTDIIGTAYADPSEIGCYAVTGAAPAVTFDGPNIIPQTGTEDVLYSFDENGEGTVASRFTGATTYALAPTSDSLPAGLTVNATTGNIEGTPTEAVTRNIIIEGSD